MRLVVALLLAALVDSACDLGPLARPSPSVRATCAALALPTASTTAAPTGTVRLSGIVRNGETCAAVAGVRVAPFDAQSGAVAISSRDLGTTDASGLFSLSLPAGTYRILFIPPTDSGLASRWWLHELSYLRATVVQSERAGLDMLLPRGLAISGNVISDTGAPLQAGVLVSPATDYYDLVTSALSDRNGHYTVMVPAGIYRVHFMTGSPWAGQWWDKRSSHADADDLTVAKDTPDVSVMLRLGRTVSGRVTYADGSPVERALAFAALPTTPDWCCEFVGNAYTDANGLFHIALPEGTYRVGFVFASSDTGRLFAYWWPNRETAMDLAGPLVVDRDRDAIDLALPYNRP